MYTAGGAEPPQLAVVDASVVEGDAGSAVLRFAVTLSEASEQSVSFSAQTSDVTASSSTDYLPLGPQRFTIQAGDTELLVEVTVSGDTLFEADETLSLTISDAEGAQIGEATGTGTIRNDDAGPALTLVADDRRVTEGDSTTVSVNLDAVAGVDIVVALSFGGTATRGDDYSIADSITVPAGQRSGSTTLTALTDADTRERTETIDIGSDAGGARVLIRNSRR